MDSDSDVDEMDDHERRRHRKEVLGEDDDR